MSAIGASGRERERVGWVPTVGGLSAGERRGVSAVSAGEKQGASAGEKQGASAVSAVFSFSVFLGWAAG